MRTAAAVANATLRRPAVLAALALLALNDHLLKGRWPSAFTGKLSDLAWPLVAVPVVAVLLAPLGRHLGRRRWALAATLATALPFVAVNLSPAAADAAARLLSAIVGPSSSVTVDPTDLLTVPAFVLPLRWLRRLPVPEPRPPGTVGTLHLAVLGLAVLGATATSCYDDRPRVQALGRDGDGHLLALVSGDDARPALARSRDAGESWQAVDDGRSSSDEPDAAFVAEVERLRAQEPRQEACGETDCYRLGPSVSTVERTSSDRARTLTLADPARDLARRRELGAHPCATQSDARSTDLTVVARPGGGERAVIARGLEGVVLVDGDQVRQVTVLGAAPADRDPVRLAVVAPEIAVLTLAAAAAWTIASAAWWVAAERRARQRGPRPTLPWPLLIVMLVAAVTGAAILLPAAFVAGVAVAVMTAAVTIGTGVAVAWLTVPLPAGWRGVPWKLAVRVALPWLAGVAAVSAWGAGWPRHYGWMLVLGTIATAGAAELGRRLAPLPSTGSAGDGPPPPPVTATGTT